jgi:citrate synthase
MSENKVLFEIKEEHLDTGLRGFPVGTVRTSFVDPVEGVHYVGYPVEDLAQLEPEAAAGAGGEACGHRPSAEGEPGAAPRRPCGEGGLEEGGGSEGV